MEEFVKIPVVDLEKIFRPDATVEDYKAVGEKIVKVVQEIGVLYFVNHGFEKDLLQRLHSSAGKFYDLDQEIKLKYRAENGFGYAPMNSFMLSKTYVKGEKEEESGKFEAFRESYSGDGLDEKEGGLPDIVEASEFRNSFSSFIRKGKELSLKLFKCFELALDIPEGSLNKLHQDLFKGRTSSNGSIGRSFSYPPFNEKVEDGMVIYLDHQDVDTFTFLFQDDVGGLEVINKKNIWQPVPPVKDAIVFNTGTCFEIWTDEKISGTRHRVVVAPNTANRKIPRRSYAFFTMPDNDAVLKSFYANQKNDKSEEITYAEHFLKYFRIYAKRV